MQYRHKRPLWEVLFGSKGLTNTGSPDRRRWPAGRGFLVLMKGHEVTDKIKAIAAELDRLGLQAWPARADSKAPARDGWRNHEGWTPPDDLQFNGTYGILMGERSGNMEMLELEGRAVNDGTAEDFFERLNDAGLGDLWAEIETGMQVFSPSGGAHYYYRVDGEPAGNTKLAFDENPDRPETLIETRGEGGFVVGPGSVTADGREWKLASGCHPRQIPTITEEQRDAIFEVAKSLDRRVRRSPESPVDSRLTAGNSGDDLRDWVTQEIGVAELLEGMGWTLEGGNGAGGALWTRPGKEPGEGTGGELKADGCFYVYSTTAQAAWRGELFEGDFPWATPIGVLAAARFDGQIDKAMSWVRSQIAATTATPERGDPDSVISGFVNSWTPTKPDFIDSMFAGTYEPVTPKIGTLHGTDAGWLYAESINTVYGPPGMGKSWVALATVLDEARRGNDCLIIDYENMPAVTWRRLIMDLGASRADIERIDIVHPDGGIGAAVDAGLLSKPYTLVVIDSVGHAMAAEGGLNSYDDGDVAEWGFRALQGVQRACGTAAVLTIDHVPKDGGSAGPIGSQRKRADISGVAWRLVSEGSRPFKRGTAGGYKMKCEKDREGTFGQGEKVDVFVNGATSPMTVQVHKENNIDDGIGPASDAPKRELVDRIMAYVEAPQVDGQAVVWVPREEVGAKSGGNRSQTLKAIDWLVEEGSLVVKLDDSGPGRPKKVVASTRDLPGDGDLDFFG